MKRSELKASIKEEILELLEAESADEIKDKAAAQAESNKELEKTQDLMKEEEEDDMDKKAMSAAKKGDSVSKLASKLQQTAKEMKSVVKKWKNAEGAEKERLTNRLRDLTKIKKELEGLL